MSRRFYWLAMLAIIALFWLAACTTSVNNSAGAELYKLNCAGCHGAEGKGGMALAIGSQAYTTTHNDAGMTLATRKGVAGTTMRAWSKSNGGTLTDEQIADIVAYLRSLD